jgi:hypothetical protein
VADDNGAVTHPQQASELPKITGAGRQEQQVGGAAGPDDVERIGTQMSEGAIRDSFYRVVQVRQLPAPARAVV